MNYVYLACAIFRGSSVVERLAVVHFLDLAGYILYPMADKRRYADRRDELIRAVAKRRRKIKSMAIEYKGGKCQICGYSKYQGSLDLHHIDPREKDFGIGDKGYTRSWEKVKAELDKCILVCANCHREVEAGVTQLPEGILVEKRGEFGETPLRKQGRSRAKSRR